MSPTTQANWLSKHIKGLLALEQIVVLNEQGEAVGALAEHAARGTETLALPSPRKQ
jgi:hypothetical protein